MSEQKKAGHAVTPRSGDTHVIGEDGAAVNIDRLARDKAAAAAAKAAAPRSPRAPAAAE